MGRDRSCTTLVRMSLGLESALWLAQSQCRAHLCRSRRRGANGLLAPDFQVEGEHLAQGTASKSEGTIVYWHTPHERFFSSLVFDAVAAALYQLVSRGGADC